MKEKEYDYERELIRQLEKDRYLRHLFNKIGKEVIVEVSSGAHIKGILKTIEFIRGIINLEVEDPQFRRSYFINWRNVVYVETEAIK